MIDPPPHIGGLDRRETETHTACARHPPRRPVAAGGVESRANIPAEMNGQLRADVKRRAEVIDKAGLERHREALRGYAPACDAATSSC
jgi:hypothetical protein